MGWKGDARLILTQRPPEAPVNWDEMPERLIETLNKWGFESVDLTELTNSDLWQLLIFTDKPRGYES